MSSVAVLTQESFAEHRSGLAQQQVKGKIARQACCKISLANYWTEAVSYTASLYFEDCFAICGRKALFFSGGVLASCSLLFD